MEITNTIPQGTWVAHVSLYKTTVWLTDYRGDLNQINIVYNELSITNNRFCVSDLSLFLNDGETFKTLIKVKRYDTIYIERAEPEENCLFNVYYIKDSETMKRILKKYHVE